MPRLGSSAEHSITSNLEPGTRADQKPCKLTDGGGLYLEVAVPTASTEASFCATGRTRRRQKPQGAARCSKRAIYRISIPMLVFGLSQYSV